jgi:hypothetical protein
MHIGLTIFPTDYSIQPPVRPDRLPSFTRGSRSQPDAPGWRQGFIPTTINSYAGSIRGWTVNLSERR